MNRFVLDLVVNMRPFMRILPDHLVRVPPDSFPNVGRGML